MIPPQSPQILKAFGPGLCCELRKSGAFEGEGEPVFCLMGAERCKSLGLESLPLPGRDISFGEVRGSSERSGQGNRTAVLQNPLQVATGPGSGV